MEDELIADATYDETPLFMIDCLLKDECPGFGVCGFCINFKHSIRLVDGKTLHFDECIEHPKGEIPMIEFIGHDGRRWKIRLDQIAWERENLPDLEEFNRRLAQFKKSKKQEEGTLQNYL
ncbi:MAG TPA: hypothetical protein EYP30_02895 [Archaeoglobaceae archaeon]|nr:hypothetical protein [Archaeoglobaceae archaeon]